ncbi:MAG TPA: ATP-binding cassette domain-containing protein [Terrimicrobiaceae bacterium]|nr:ATP-binding cassette domain-containing protein [Terrimicrobiaceae bacterium]
MAGAISVRNLSVVVRDGRRSKRLLDDVSFEIAAGHFIAVIGASGCGKSTLIKSLAGLIPPTAGTVHFAGLRAADLQNGLPLAIGYLPQFCAFHGALTVGENLETACALRLPHHVPQERRRAWLQHITELARIAPLLGQKYRTLSGGQTRRMVLAEELIGDPAFLLLDELTSGLDAFSDQEMMNWLRRLAHDMAKTVVLVTHSTNNLDCCDAILFLHQGRLIHFGDYASLLESHGAGSIAELFGMYQTLESPEPAGERPEPVTATGEAVPQTIRSLPPPGGFAQFPALLKRQVRLFWRDRGQIVLHIALILTFPFLVAVFATSGLPQVRSQTLSLETNILRTLQEQLFYLRESFQAASLISGLAMFQVILLTLIGANNGAREIAKERNILAKELRAGLSPGAYVSVKFLQIMVLSLIQAFWMAWFVKTLCGFPGVLADQFAILFAGTLAMSTTCLALSAASPSPERASLLAIYLVGFQLPLSGAALALPDWLSIICRPFIAAYWGWSGYLQTFQDTRYFEIVRQSRETWIAPFGVSIAVLGVHIGLALLAAIFLTGRIRTHSSE